MEYSVTQVTVTSCYWHSNATTGQSLSSVAPLEPSILEDQQYPHTLHFALTLQINVDRIVHFSPSLTIVPVSTLCSSAPSLQSCSHFFISLSPLLPSPYIQLLSGKKSSQCLPQIEPCHLYVHRSIASAIFSGTNKPRC